jgi:hypothetical protein
VSVRLSRKVPSRSSAIGSPPNPGIRRVEALVCQLSAVSFSGTIGGRVKSRRQATADADP